MRIISGKYGRRRFDVPKGFRLRPTTDVAKEALFAMIHSRMDLSGCRVLDLFAGTGSIGLECVSRGALWVDMVEKNPKQVAFIRSVIEELGVTSEAAVHVGNVFRWLTPQEGDLQEPYDLIFADPPYNLNELGTIPEAVFASQRLANGGLFILEHPEGYDFSSQPYFLMMRRYSAVHFSLFE